MVWNTTQSSLYKAVSDYNERLSCKETHKEAKFPNDCRESGNNAHCKSQSRCQRCADCPHRRNNVKPSASPLAGFNADKDFMLLVGLIILLSENSADPKLIAALAIALLG